MAGRRLLYLTAAAGCCVFYIAYGEWLSCLILVCVLALPWFSLLLSIPAMLRFRASPAGPEAVQVGEPVELWLLGSCPVPMPPFRGRLVLRRCFTGKVLRYCEPMPELTAHCGGYVVTPERLRICDYLGLFAFGVRKKDSRILRIRPKPLAVTLNEDLHRQLARAWKPKFGGGFAENHELRLYRPGDSLNQVHWKLSAKTGKLILRQAMEPQQGLVLLTLNLRGTPEELDRKLGRLLWLGHTFTRQEIPFEIRALTGEGIISHHVHQPEQVDKALDDLLCRRTASPQEDIRQRDFAAAWLYHIGGEADEP